MKMRVFIVSVLAVGFPYVSSEVVDTFDKCSRFFFRGKPPVIPGILERSVSQNKYIYKTICQKYKEGYRYATFYNTTSRIPVFSAYTYTMQNTSQRRPPILSWMSEPQLEPANNEMNTPFANQAIDDDWDLGNRSDINRGHLFPSGYAPDNITAASTFTLTNAVPQMKSFNGGSWNRMERQVSKIMQNYCRDKMNQNEVLAHVLTGAVPGNSQLNYRVNIPSYMWTAFCCYNSTSSTWVSQSYWALNQKEANKDNTIPAKSLQELQEFLNTNWVKIMQLFYNNCEKN